MHEGLGEWRAFMTKWYPEGDQSDASTTFGYGVAKGAGAGAAAVR
jgi:branched-chain amino acid transport system substrate-binding protein